MIRRMQRQAVSYHSRSAALASGHSPAYAQECVHACGAQKVQHAEYANEHTLLQVDASNESTLTNYEYKASLQ